MKTALISTSNKTGIVDLVKKLVKMNFRIISTGGTYELLKKNHIKAKKIDKVTNFPEIMDGRVKTLHPKIHGGLLCIRNNEVHQSQAEKHKIKMIDLVVINLYPFEKTINDPKSSWADVLENIDIGGPAMIRSSAKNYQYVTVIIDPNDYEKVVSEIEIEGETRLETRLELAQKAFNHTYHYDLLIADAFNNYIYSQKRALHSNEAIDKCIISISKTLHDEEIKKTSKKMLRYGENPHQPAFYIENLCNEEIISQLHGKELSYNNLLDIDAALKTILKFSDPTVVILKHTNPCGIASANDLSTAYEKAFCTDTISPYGGIVVVNNIIDIDFVKTINKVFTEIVISPGYTEAALNLLIKKTDRRIIKYEKEYLPLLKKNIEIHSCINGYLSQVSDLYEDNLNEWVYPTINKPTKSELSELTFAWQVVKMLKSNAVCFTKNKQTIGMGIGQTSRIDSINIAINRASKMKLDLQNSVCASDGFFPFRDSIDRLNEIGVKYVIQPGGSKSDPEVIKACEEYGIVMVFTHRRHFRH